MSYATGELDRMFAAMMMLCVVEELDLTASPPKVRVRRGGWISAWVRWHSQAAGKARHWRVPSKGEQGMLLSPSGNPAMGTFVPGLYGDAGPAPDNRDHVEVWSFEDGGSLTYDWQAGSYTIDLPTGTVSVKVGGSELVVTDGQVEMLAGQITLTGPTTISGAVTIDGPLTVAGDILGGGAIIDTTGNTPNHAH
ncbi:phage baseplate assembly protein V [Pseudomonas sp. NA-150]|uniref:phage baseplate assembly protein V n=1 Tax=Pseudomonas sp. NA-150 TaxID=3367525 RepID=UPI0037C9351E